MIQRPPRSTLIPSTTLFRSTVELAPADHAQHKHEQREHREDRDDPKAEHARQRHAPAATVLRDFVEPDGDRKSTRLNSSHANISYAVFCLKKKKQCFTRISI